MGRAYLAEARYHEAELALREATRLLPAPPSALRLLALARLGQGRFEEAIAALEEWQSQADRPAEEDRHLAAASRWIESARVLAESLRGPA
jgi:tetratricopeptide (TPR) repeat protein